MFIKFYNRKKKKQKHDKRKNMAPTGKPFSSYMFLLYERDYPDGPADMISDNIEHITHYAFVHHPSVHDPLTDRDTVGHYHVLIHFDSIITAQEVYSWWGYETCEIAPADRLASQLSYMLQNHGRKLSQKDLITNFPVKDYLKF